MEAKKDCWLDNDVSSWYFFLEYQKKKRKNSLLRIWAYRFCDTNNI
jgi:hypothetical protein